MTDFKHSGTKRPYENHGSGYNRQNTGRPAFGQKKWDGASRPITMHKATCAKCGNPCEVPFRPFDNRLVYCATCFQGKKGAQDEKSYNRFPQKSYNDNRNFAKPSFRNDAGTSTDNGFNGQLEMLNAKIDRLIKAVEAMANIEPGSPDTGTDEATKTNPIAKVRKGIKRVFKKNKRPF